MEPKRIIFQNQTQKEFFIRLLNRKSLRSFWIENENCLGLSYNSLKKYYSGKLTLPEPLFYKLLEISGLSLSEINVTELPANWWCKAAGIKGMRGLHQKYGLEQFKKWRKAGYEKMQSKLLASGSGALLKEITLPNQITLEVAEFIGVYLGDGSLTDYFINISGDFKHDIPYFEYLQRILYSSFGLNSVIRKTDKVCGLSLRVFSKKLCNYFKSIGLQAGDKIRNQSKIPAEICENEKLFYACLRGLVDTDGFIGKDGKVLAIRFYNKNNALMQQLRDSEFIKELFKIRNHDTEIGTRSQKSIDEFFRLVGSSNPRHIIRYLEGRKGNLLYKRKLLPYYCKYSALQLPYLIGNSTV